MGTDAELAAGRAVIVLGAALGPVAPLTELALPAFVQAASARPAALPAAHSASAMSARLQRSQARSYPGDGTLTRRGSLSPHHVRPRPPYTSA